MIIPKDNVKVHSQISLCPTPEADNSYKYSDSYVYVVTETKNQIVSPRALMVLAALAVITLMAVDPAAANPASECFYHYSSDLNHWCFSW